METKESALKLKVRVSAEWHKKICEGLTKLYESKNKAYGDSFHQTFLEEGFAMPRIRLTDKLERFKTLTKDASIDKGDESVRDTLLDLANYAIMTVMEIDREWLEAPKYKQPLSEILGTCTIKHNLEYPYHGA